jgi:thioredoxin reductase (NADPH)
MYDVAILGAGPAGLSAAINLKLHNQNVIWFGTPTMSGKVARSEKIANYPGLGLVTGAELNQRFQAHAQELGLTLTDHMVSNILGRKGSYMLLADNELYEARTVLFTIGAVSAQGLPGEQALLGHGVSYCATCDGFLYPGKTIAVYCADPRYEHEVTYLAGIAQQVYLYTPYASCGVTLPNVVQLERPFRAVYGEKQVEGIQLFDGTELPLQGVFFLRNAVAPAVLLKGLAMDGPHIAVNRQCETNLPGCFAAGDCTGRPYQIAKAVGEGNVAAHAILEYLAKQEGE